MAAAPLLERRRPDTSPCTVTAVLLALALITGIGATWTVIDVGHSGAKATWDDVGEADG